MSSKIPTKLFGTDGIRAKAGEFPLDSPTVRIIGASLARHLRERAGGTKPRIVSGRDTREHGELIERELIAGATSTGAQVESAGIITTPGVAYLAGAERADAGVVISASHNPYDDNGIKVFDPSGRKLDDETERRIESDVAAGTFQDSIGAVDCEQSLADADRARKLQNRYLEHLEAEVARDLSLENLTIVIDCANGAAFELAPRLFANLRARVIAINDHPDGRNINLNCGSLHIEGLQERVIAEHADIGVAFDGDADRALFVDAEGNFVDGDATMWVLANYLLGRGQLDKNTVVATVMTNLGLEVALRARGIQMIRTAVGDKYVLDELLRSGAALGGEQSGHIIFPRISLAGDGMITTLKLLRVIREERKPLAQLAGGFRRYPQVLLNVAVRERIPFENLPAVNQLARETTRALGERGRLLLRYSGTEPQARVMVEGEDESEVKSRARALAELIDREIGATADRNR